MQWHDWLLVGSSIFVIWAVLWDVYDTAYRAQAEDTKDEVERMLDIGQQPGSWEP
jgi:hypothetical protein